MDDLNIKKINGFDETNKQLKRIADQLQWSNWLKFIEVVRAGGYTEIDDKLWERIGDGIGINRFNK